MRRQLYSYLIKPTTANHNVADVVMRQFNAMLGGGPGERADYLQSVLLSRFACCRSMSRSLRASTRKIDLPLAPVLAEGMERIGIGVDLARNWTRCLKSMEKRSPAPGKRNLETGWE